MSGARAVMGRLVASVLLVLLCTGSTPGEELLAEGIAHYTYGRYEESIEVLTRARDEGLEPARMAELHLYLGLDYAVLGEQERADEAFTRALTHDPLVRPDPYRIKPALVQQFEELRGRLRGAIQVETDRPAAEVRLDERTVGHGSVRSEVAVGAHRVEIRSGEDGPVEVREVAVGPRQTVRVEVRFGASIGAGERGTDGPEPSFWGRDRLWTWLAAGGAVASLAAAGGMWLAVRSEHAEYQDPATPDATARDLEGPIRSKVLATNVLLGVGAGLGLTAVVLLFLEGAPDGAAERARRRAPSLTLAPTGLWLDVSF